MRWRATLFALKQGEDVKFIAVSPKDDVLFVSHEDAPKDFQRFGEQACRGTEMAPVGYLMEMEP